MKRLLPLLYVLLTLVAHQNPSNKVHPYEVGPRWEARLKSYYIPRGLSYESGVSGRLYGFLAHASVSSQLYPGYLAWVSSLPGEVVEDIAAFCREGMDEEMEGADALQQIACAAAEVHDWVLENLDVDATGLASDGLNSACQAHARGLAQVIHALNLPHVKVGYIVTIGKKFNHVANYIEIFQENKRKTYVVDATINVTKTVLYPYQ